MIPSTCSAQKTQVNSKRENKDESNMFKENINDKPESKSLVPSQVSGLSLESYGPPPFHPQIKFERV